MNDKQECGALQRKGQEQCQHSSHSLFFGQKKKKICGVDPGEGLFTFQLHIYQMKNKLFKHTCVLLIKPRGNTDSEAVQTERIKKKSRGVVQRWSDEAKGLNNKGKV